MTLRQVIAMTYTYYSRGQVASDDLVEMYAGDLSDLDPAACVDAYNRYRRNPANKIFPLPAQIRELVNPEEFVAPETMAREIAARIVGAIPKFGWANAREAQAYIGPDGWALVNRAGGWRHLCETTQTKQAPILQAQFRDQLEGSLRYGQGAVEESVGALDVPRAREKADLTRIGDVMRLLPIPAADDSGPEGAA
jgi:hypothetical protein